MSLTPAPYDDRRERIAVVWITLAFAAFALTVSVALVEAQHARRQSAIFSLTGTHSLSTTSFSAESTTTATP